MKKICLKGLPPGYKITCNKCGSPFKDSLVSFDVGISKMTLSCRLCEKCFLAGVETYKLKVPFGGSASLEEKNV